MTSRQFSGGHVTEEAGWDVATGRELWQAPRPAGGKATLMTYMVNGRQYVAIAAGGDGAFFGKGDQIVVFMLPIAR